MLPYEYAWHNIWQKKHKTGPTICLSSSVLKGHFTFYIVQQPPLNPPGLQAFRIENSNLTSWRWAQNPFCCHSQPGSCQRVILLNRSKTQTSLTENYWAKPRQVWARHTYSEQNRDKFHSCNVNRWLVELRIGNPLEMQIFVQRVGDMYVQCTFWMIM